jgi:hypothetical protein
MNLRAINRHAALTGAALAGLSVLTAVTGCAIHPPAATAPQKTNLPAQQPAITAEPSPTPAVPPSSPPSESAAPITPAVPSPPWRPPPAATTVAENYAAAALSFDWTHPGAAAARLRSISTPQWAAQLDADADGGEGGQAGLIAAHATITAHLLSAYPSAGPGPGERIEVTAIVAVLGHAPATHPAAVAIDLLPQPGGHWLVAWSQ